MDNQINRLTEVMDKMNAIPQGRHNQQNIPYKHFIHRHRGHRDFSSYDRSRGNFGKKGHIYRIEYS